jgi:N-terminal domain on NACHT_NTPase and P-loop NTPases
MEVAAIAFAAAKSLITVVSASGMVHQFIESVRDSQSNLNSMDRELILVKGVLEQLQRQLDTASKFPSNNLSNQMRDQIIGILECCQETIKQIQSIILTYERITTSTNIV